MNKNHLLLFLAIFFLLVAQHAIAQTAIEKITQGPEKGSLLIAGGGKLSQDIWDKFIELAGGKSAKIIVIPTAIGENAVASGESTVKQLQLMGIQNVIVLHTINKEEADKESFVKPLLDATGVWFGGGRQWRLADSYLNTRTHQEIQKMLDRGGVVGGSSAGATIQGSFMVRGDTKNNTTMIGDHIEGMGFLKNATIDQHVMRRNRQFDLIPVIEKNPELLGIGIDESTAIVVSKNQFEVIGESYVAVHNAKLWEVEKEKEGKVIHPFFYMSKGQQYDLLNRKLITNANNNNTKE